MDQPRVCHVINSLTHGGAEHLLIDLVKAMEGMSFIVVYFGDDGDLASDLRAAGATVYRLDERLRFDPFAAARLWNILGSEEVDIVHAHLPYSQTVARVVAKLRGDIPVVSTQHNVPSNYHPVTRTTERVTRQLDEATVAVSQGVERAFTGQANTPGELNGQWCTIYNGIDVRGFGRAVKSADGLKVRDRLGISTDSKVLLNVGRYVEAKAQSDLMEGLSRTELNNLETIIVGHGPLESELRSTSIRLGVDDRTHITGRVKDVEPYYAAADAFVSTSRAEGLPVTILEAMSSKLPVVAPDIPGVNEVVVPGETGHLYTQGSIDELVGSIEEVVELNNREAWAKNGYTRARNLFDIESMAGSYSDIYQRISTERYHQDQKT
jgi:glycosyltransferase involved in cell wall biosynthesis